MVTAQHDCIQEWGTGTGKHHVRYSEGLAGFVRATMKHCRSEIFFSNELFVLMYDSPYIVAPYLIETNSFVRAVKLIIVGERLSLRI